MLQDASLAGKLKSIHIKTYFVDFRLHQLAMILLEQSIYVRPKQLTSSCMYLLISQYAD